MNDEERHANHHRAIEERIKKFRSFPKRVAKNSIIRYRRREAHKDAWFTLRSHLASPHGLKPNGLGHDALSPFITLDEMIERHEKLHKTP